MAPHEWDAPAYDALPLPHVAWGRRVIERLAPPPGARVLDAGCGTGRDAAELLGRRDDVSLLGVDASRRMVEQARERLAPFGERAAVAVGDLTEPLPVDGTVDAVMSVAAFHWITDHDLLFSRLAAVMRPGARLVTDCGGQGQLAVMTAALVEVTGSGKFGTSFKGVDETRRSLEGAGFEVVDVRLRPDPLRLEDPVLMDRYLATVNLSSYLADLPGAEHAAFVTSVREAMHEPVIDYVRLEIDAVRR